MMSGLGFDRQRRDHFMLNLSTILNIVWLLRNRFTVYSVVISINWMFFWKICFFVIQMRSLCIMWWVFPLKLNAAQCKVLRSAKTFLMWPEFSAKCVQICQVENFNVTVLDVDNVNYFISSALSLHQKNKKIPVSAQFNRSVIFKKPQAFL